MKDRDYFALAIRILGLIGLAHLLHSVIVDVYRQSHMLDWTYLVWKVAMLLAGLYCLRGAPLIVAVAYPDESKPPSAKPTAG
jgi:hypothetical protein